MKHVLCLLMFALLSSAVLSAWFDPHNEYLRERIRTSRQNVLNKDCTRDEHGEIRPYRRKMVVWDPATRTHAIVDDPSPCILRYDAAHPDADGRGYVAYPNVDVSLELIDRWEAEEALYGPAARLARRMTPAQRP